MQYHLYSTETDEEKKGKKEDEEFLQDRQRTGTKEGHTEKPKAKDRVCGRQWKETLEGAVTGEAGVSGTIHHQLLRRQNAVKLWFSDL